MVKRSWSNQKEIDYLRMVSDFLIDKTTTSTKKLRKEFGISGRRAAMILKELEWKRHRRNGASGTTYKITSY